MDQRASSRPGPGGDIVGKCMLSSHCTARYLKESFTGININVDESGEQPSQNLKFWKSKARVIEIGRRSGQAKGNEDNGKHALFRCPVISRRHAKITFSEYGNVRLNISSVRRTI